MRSAPQKQPIPTTAYSSPAGNGGAIGVPSVSCRSGTPIGSSRPGSASSAVTSVGFEKRCMRVPGYPAGSGLCRRRADVELARRLARRPHADALRALDQPVAVAVDLDDVAFAGRGGQRLLVDAPAAVREHELEAVADGVAPRRGGRGLTKQECVLLDQLERLRAPGPLLVRVDAPELAASRRKSPLQRFRVGLGEIASAHVLCHPPARAFVPPPM